LPADFSAPILIVQHVTEGFGAGLVAWLDQQTALSVKMAAPGMPLLAGEVLVAPDSCHLLLDRQGKVALQSPTAADRHCPSADVLFQSVAQVKGKTAVGVILTGMGRDGAQGLYELRQLGGHTIAQDEATSIIYGMPGTAVQLKAVEQIRPLAEIAPALLTLISTEK
jgi:two-component system chemotaxis response regulator CheB